MMNHDDKVEDIINQMKQRGNKPITLRKSVYSHMPRDLAYKKDAHPIDTSLLTDILEVNTKEEWIKCEGQVTLGQLVKASLKYHLVPKVCPEFNTFTVAGLVNGRGIQTSSHKFGMFEENIIEVECVLGDGRKVIANANENSDLFMGIRGSYGTIALVTAVTVALMPCKSYVQSNYYAFDNIHDFASFFRKQLSKPTYLDAIVYSKTHYVVICSDFVDEVSEDANIYHPEIIGNEWYYQYVRRITSNNKTYVDYINVMSFQFRSQRGIWWAIETAIGNQTLCRIPFIRKLVDQLAEKDLEKYGFSDPFLSDSESQRTFVNQDQGFFVERLEERIEWCLEYIGVTPIWVCGIYHEEDNSLRIDIGLYGDAHPQKKGHVFDCVQDLRAWQLSADFPAAWGYVYLKKEEFEEFAGEKYEALRKKYSSDGAFKHIVDKVQFYNDNDAERLSGGPIKYWRELRTWRRSKLLFFSIYFLLLFFLLVIFFVCKWLISFVF